MSNKDLTPKELSELKTYVFAMYWGQTIMVYEHAKIKERQLINEHTLHRELLGTKCLQVNHLSSITDEHAIEVAKILTSDGFVDIESNAAILQMHINNAKKVVLGTTQLYNRSMWYYINVYQYLQQQGYALPIYFKGVHYSVEDLIKLGIYAKMD